MTVLFRTDASAEIGTGHVMRCLALAQTLAKLGRRPVFVSRQMFPNLLARIEAAGFGHVALPPAESDNAGRAEAIPHAHWLKASAGDDAAATAKVAATEGANWVVVDHYGVDITWERTAGASGLKIAFLDDLADRAHAPDLLVDPSLNRNPHDRYRDLTPSGTQLLLGPRYAILRDEFIGKARIRATSPPFRLLIAFGGVDAAGMTVEALEAAASAGAVISSADVVVGGQNAALPDICAHAERLGWTVHVDSDQMATLMDRADIAIGAGGHMLWERAAMGLPTLAVVVAPNQEEQVAQAAAEGVVASGPPAGEPGLAETFAAFVSDGKRLEAMSKAAAKAVDGLGALRIARRIAGAGVRMRRAEASDKDSVLAWRNHPRIRAVSRADGEISAEDHGRWFAGVLGDPTRALLIGEDDAGPVGVVRFDAAGDEAEVSIYLTPDRLGQGVGPNLLLAGEDWLRQNWPGVATVRAEVLPGNAASEELFLSCGYRRGQDGLFRKPTEPFS